MAETLEQKNQRLFNQMSKDTAGAVGEAGGARRTAQLALQEAANAKSYALQGLGILKELAKRGGLSDEDITKITDAIKANAVDVKVVIDGKEV